MTKVDYVVIVPARLASTRLPQKPLVDIGGKPMLLRVLQQASQSGAQQVIAAVEDDILFNTVTAAGYQAVRTGDCSSGSERVAAAAAQLKLPEDRIVVNVQGDEPFMEPEVIRGTAQLLSQRLDCGTATAMRSAHAGEYESTAAVKVVYDADGTARYFSRAPIPHFRTPAVKGDARIHLGIYAYRMAALQHLTQQSPAPLEQAEQLEQLRILWHGGKIAIWMTESKSFGIDTPEDLERARATFL